MNTVSAAIGGVALTLLSSSLSAQWNQATPATSPSARAGSGMTYDTNLGAMLLFGGGGGFSTYNETWSFDGTTWTQLTPAASPSGTLGTELVHDVVRGVTVMYGSLNTSPFGGPSVDETWEFDGTTWTQVFPTTTPGGLGNYGACYDIVRNRTVIYGGTANSWFPTAEGGTWEFDGTNWSLISTVGTPGLLERPAMCYDIALGKAVLFGGIDPNLGGNDTTWLYDGTNWTAATIAGASPAGRTGAKMAYDSVRGVCVMTGGLDLVQYQPMLETWEFDGTTWTQITGGTTGRYNDAFAFLPTVRQVVQFGGLDPTTYSELGDTWLYGAKSRTYGSGCAGTNGVPSLTAVGAPRIGQTFTLTLSNLLVNSSSAVMAIGLSDQTSPLGPLPVSLTNYGMPGCSVWTSTDFAMVIPANAGSATWSINLPNHIAFAGVRLFHQGLSIDAGANATGLAVSNAHASTIGL
jgi:hypothetical protein